MGDYNFGMLSGESVSAVTATNSIGPGARQWVSGNEYVYVYNGGNSQIPPTYGATLSQTVGTSGYTVTVSSVTSASPLAGVVKHATLTTGTYGWLLVKGIATAEVNADTSLGTTHAESVAVLGTDGVFSRVTGATGYLALGAGGAYAMGATASGGSVLCKIFGVL
jgi:hypothetical protein